MLEQDPSSVAAMQIAVAGLSLVVFFGALLEPIKAWRDQGRIAWPILRDSLPAAAWSSLFLVLSILGHPALALTFSAAALFYTGIRLARLQADTRGNYYLALGFAVSSGIFAAGQGGTATAAAILCVFFGLVVFLKGISAGNRRNMNAGPGR